MATRPKRKASKPERFRNAKQDEVVVDKVPESETEHSEPKHSEPESLPAASESSSSIDDSISTVRTLKRKVKDLTQEVDNLKDERDFLRSTLQAITRKGNQNKKSRKTSSTSSSGDTSTSSDTSRDEEKKKGKKNMKARNSKMSNCHPLSIGRARTPEEVLRRYQKVLKAFKKLGSMSKAFQFVGTDRNTMALSSTLAEILIVEPKHIKSIQEFDPKKEKLLDYCKRCFLSLTPELKKNIEEKKANGRLLPLTPKFR
ncbi:hypothetical protein UPYG_G00111310 [Umbra pygmaea]|uniref:Coiled-coil domain-containing protein 106 n=1 Tax=Umbra pygmaea TaxID=75934 RepID=A0ABD0XQH3_UMBPY